MIDFRSATLLTCFLIFSISFNSSAVAASERFVEKTTGMQFTVVQAGCSVIGSNEKEGKKGTKACVSKFFIAVYPVTQGEWKRIMGDNPSAFSSCGDDCPVDRVNWLDAQDFISKLNKETGGNYRLPTEVEWEFACRSGRQGDLFCGGNNLDEVAWHAGNSGKTTHPVGKKKPNDWGIYDMTGNVWEWVQDWYDDKYPSATQDPKGPENGTQRVFRGGGYRSDRTSARIEMRFRDSPTHTNKSNGFRLAFSKLDR